ncbi:ABC transporter substrate-binding protein [Homoserinibacter sp. YIM 151385]|uniref:ABC transporter substrate-binding protein n=1 Tax=Homoserinibacter sp. YIM 151385 TaxID=2985506 RepID=UPI0022F12C31|nr:ABC transporter substrate-binding protein [Homoserinibacter sp. YIM 151385]WBU37664.1 ABC transporter substrate-binding protein [Homoserinibacter sp. YIM 151385]
MRTTTQRAAAVTGIALVAALALSACSTPEAPTDPAASGDPELFALLPEDIQDAGEMIVATDANYPPCDFVNEEGDIDGFNHDLLMAMAEKLGITITQESIAFDGLIPGVQGGKYPAAMECISDRLERQEQVTFIDNAYATSGVLTLADNPAGVSENPLSLCGVSVGIQTGTDYVADEALFSENCEQEGLEALDAIEFPSATEVTTALQSGRVEASFTNLATGAYQNLQTDGAVTVFPSPLMSKVYNGIIVAHESEDLAQALLGALEAIIADGTYEEIMAEWGLESQVLLEPGINLATERPIEEPTACGACGLD